MKKLLVLIFAIISITCLIAITSSAVIPEAVTDCVIGEGEDKIVKTPTAGLDYTILDASQGTATLSGNGGITSGEIVIASSVKINGVYYDVVQTNYGVFKGTSITAIYVPNTVERILGSANVGSLDDSGTFANCKTLSEVYIGTGIKEIGRFCFTSIGATSGVSKFIVKGRPQIIKEYAFNCAKFSNDCIIECDTSDLRIIESNAFANGGKALKVINSPVLESIGEKAFGSSSNIEYVLVPENCTLGKYVFNGLSNLKTVIIRCAEDEVKELPQETFSNDSKFDLFIDGQVIATGNHVLGFGDMRVYFENYEDIGVFVESINSGYQGNDRLGYVKFYTCNPSDDGYYKFTANKSSVITADTTVTVAPHALDSKVGIVIEATCSTYGKTYDVCEICDRELNVVDGTEYDDKNHHFETVEKQEPTCVKDGYEILTCSLCDNTFEKVLVRTGHDFKETVKAPSCTAIGFTTYECKSCGHKEIGLKTPQSVSHVYASTEIYVSDDGKLIKPSACIYCNAGGQNEEISLIGKMYIKGYKDELYNASEGLTFTYDEETKTATVTGGTLSSTALYIPSFVEYNGEAYKVTAIAAKAFQGKGLTAVYVPDTVTEMKGGSGKGCFGNNVSLTTIVVGSGVTVIEQEVFSMNGMTYIEEFVFKGTITSIATNAFNYLHAATAMTGYEFNTRLEYVGAYIQGSNRNVRANLIKEVYITYNCDVSSQYCFNGAAGLTTAYIEGGKTADTAKILTRELFSGDASLSIYISGYVKAYVDPNGSKVAGQAVLPTNGASIHMQSQDAMKVFVASLAANEYSSRASNSTWYDCETAKYFRLKTMTTDVATIVFNSAIGDAQHKLVSTVVEPTCNREGLESVSCFVCAKNIESNPIDKLDHVRINEVITSMPNCKDTGIISYTCLLCESNIVDEIAIDPEYHNYKVIILYSNGFDKKGTQYDRCEFCDDEKNIVEIKPIFTPKGYSMNGAGDAIIAGYEINIEMLENYKDHYDVKFGVIIGNAEYFTGNAFIENGKMNNDFGIQLEITKFDFSMIKCTITGYNESYDNLQLVVALYVIDADGNVSYVQKTDSGYYESTVTKDTVLGAFTRTTIKNVFDSLVDSTQVKAIIPGDDE